MYKVVVVDDEMYVRKGILKAIQWEQNQLELAGEAENGATAIQLADTTKPDILITDMKMPGMDGVGLIKALKEIAPQTKIIVISAYSDFDYTREAIVNKVFDYVLKPIKKDELNEVIRRCVLEIEATRANVRGNRNVPVNIEKLVEELLHHATGNIRLEHPERQEIEGLLGYPSLCCCVAKIDDFPRATALQTAQDCFQSVKEIFINGLAHFDEFNIALLNRIRKEIVIISGAEKWNPEKVFLKMQELIADSLSQRQLGISVGIGATVSSPYRLYQSYDQALTAVKLKKLQESCVVLSFQEQSVCQAAEAIYPAFGEQRFLNSLSQGNEAESQRLFEAVCAVYSEKNATVDLLQKKMFLLLEEIEKVLNQVGTGMERVCGKSCIQYINGVMAAFCLPEIEAMFADLIRQVTLFFNASKKKGAKKIVAEIVASLRREYFKPLSIHEYAAKYYLNPDYLGRIFKNETGQSFGDFLTEVRIDTAKMMIANHDTKYYYEIATAVGYQDYRYFCKVFKTVSGLTPGEYQEKLSGPSPGKG